MPVGMQNQAAVKHRKDTVADVRVHRGWKRGPHASHIDVTRDIIAALAVMGVALHGHLMLVKTKYVRPK